MWGIDEFHREGTAWTVVGASCEGVAMGMVGLDFGRLFDETRCHGRFMLWLSRALIALAVGYLGRRLLSLRRRAARLKWVP